MTNIVIIEIDLDSISAKDRADALYKAAKEDVLGRGSVPADIQAKIVDELVNETAYETMKRLLQPRSKNRSVRYNQKSCTGV